MYTLQHCIFLLQIKNNIIYNTDYTTVKIDIRSILLAYGKHIHDKKSLHYVELEALLIY